MAQRVVDTVELGVEIVPEGGTPSGPPSGIPGGVTGLPGPSVMKEGTYLDDHKAVKRVIDKAGYKYMCTTPAEVAAATGFPLEIVNEHLALLEIDEAAKFVQKGTENPTICGADALQRLVENLRKLKV
jgi:hypothetical protein